ncbi:recombinase family protein [Edaphobacter paludis]|uniref:Recombinase family protein n=1 Tax=Edaphobacter paludis TaxID=3035702 RepID=A0AAU7D4S4_9BACT
MKKAFAYLRVSGKGQLDGDGFTRQGQAIERYANVNGITIVETFQEEGVSGTKELDDRPALQDLLAALKEGDVKVVILEKLDRLARDLMIQETILSDLMKQGFEVISVCEPDLCSTDPSRVLVRQIFGAIAQYDRAMTVLKLRGARQRMKVREGRCEGRKAFGARSGESQAIARMRELRSGGMAVDKIAEQLNAEGIATRMGKGWHGMSVSRILKATP